MVGAMMKKKISTPMGNKFQELKGELWSQGQWIPSMPNLRASITRRRAVHWGEYLIYLWNPSWEKNAYAGPAELSCQEYNQTLFLQKILNNFLYKQIFRPSNDTVIWFLCTYFDLFQVHFGGHTNSYDSDSSRFQPMADCLLHCKSNISTQ